MCVCVDVCCSLYKSIYNFFESLCAHNFCIGFSGSFYHKLSFSFQDF